jgi:signal transduction histidine kinase
VLTEGGLEPALVSIAKRAAVPVVLEHAPEERLHPTVEITAYFVVAEALTNVARYAEATRAIVSVRRVGGVLGVEVRDDGRGGARMDGGSGLRGLLDRVSAIGGTLVIDSPPDGGTMLRAELPCVS